MMLAVAPQCFCVHNFVLKISVCTKLGQQNRSSGITSEVFTCQCCTQFLAVYLTMYNCQLTIAVDGFSLILRTKSTLTDSPARILYQWLEYKLFQCLHHEHWCWRHCAGNGDAVVAHQAWESVWSVCTLLWHGGRLCYAHVILLFYWQLDNTRSVNEPLFNCVSVSVLYVRRLAIIVWLQTSGCCRSIHAGWQ